MQDSRFFRVAWGIQLLTGIALFSVSLYIENQVMQAFLAGPLLALALTAALETGKGVAIVWHRYMQTEAGLSSFSTRIFSGLFRFGLVALSLISSLLYLAAHLDRPNLSQAREQDRRSIEQTRERELSRLRAQRGARIDELFARQSEERDEALRPHHQRIAQLEAERRAEMDNVVHGVFKGKRYREFERLLNDEKRELAKLAESIAQYQRQEADTARNRLDAGFDARARDIQESASTALRRLVGKDYAEDERANDPRIVAFLKIVESVFGKKAEPLQFVFVFSILLSLLMEIGIVIAFDTITLTVLARITAARHAEAIEQFIKTEASGDAAREEQRHKSEVDRVRKRAGDTLRDAETAYGAFRQGAI